MFYLKVFQLNTIPPIQMAELSKAVAVQENFYSRTVRAIYKPQV